MTRNQRLGAPNPCSNPSEALVHEDENERRWGKGGKDALTVRGGLARLLVVVVVAQTHRGLRVGSPSRVKSSFVSEFLIPWDFLVTASQSVM